MVIWNELPEEVVEADMIESCRHLDRYLDRRGLGV